jgi:hypothetical protein
VSTVQASESISRTSRRQKASWEKLQQKRRRWRDSAEVDWRNAGDCKDTDVKGGSRDLMLEDRGVSKGSGGRDYNVQRLRHCGRDYGLRGIDSREPEAAKSPRFQ